MIAALKALTDSGVPCYVMHGNRDFLLGERFCRESGCKLLEDPTIISLHGDRVLAMHGDTLCTDDHSYQKLRAMVRDPGWQQMFLALSHDQRQMLAAQARAGSKAHIAQAMSEIMDVNTQYRSLLSTRDELRVAQAVQVASRERVRLELDRYAQRTVLLSDALLAQSALAQANTRNQEALSAYLTAVANLSRAIGEN